MKTVGWNILLLSFGFFVSALESTQCPPPTAYHPVVLDQKSHQKRPYNTGERVNLKCAEGFVPSKGGRSMECMGNGQWSPVTLKCEKISCGNAGDLLNGQFNYEGIYIGERVYAECNEGYTLKGMNYLTCERSGWTGDFPSCELMKKSTTCPAPMVPNSSKKGHSSVYRVGDGKSITCNQGFELAGPQWITCGSNGQWQPSVPQCRPSFKKAAQFEQPMGCGPPPPAYKSNARLADSFMKMTNFPSGTKVQYVCEVGYGAKGGSRYRTCRNGDWSPLLLQCERKSCGSAGEILNGQFLYTGVEFGDKATAVCDKGYNLVGKATRNCMSKGWDGRIPTCEAVGCPEPPVVDNAVLEGLGDGTYTYRRVVSYRCLKGTLIGQRQITCTANGSWSAPPPKCKEIGCPAPNVPNAYWRTPASGKFQPWETVQVTCNPGFSPSKPQSITCGNDGRWQPKLPQCQKQGARDFGGYNQKG